MGPRNRPAGLLGRHSLPCPSHRPCQFGSPCYIDRRGPTPPRREAMTRPLFVLLGIPVWVSGWHFLILAMLFMWAFNHGVAFGIAAVLVGSFSTLAHEFGHGIVSKVLGLEP